MPIDYHKAFDFTGKTAPVRIFRTLDPREGKWYYTSEMNAAWSKARSHATDYGMATDVRLLEVERTLNKDMLVSMLMGDSTQCFWKNEYIVAKMWWTDKEHWDTSDRPRTLHSRELEGYSRILVPTSYQKIEAERAERAAKAREEEINEKQRARAERAQKAKEAAEEAIRKARANNSSQRADTENNGEYFASMDEFEVWWETHKNSANPPNKFEKELRICKPYSKDDAISAYRRRAKETHPDVGGSKEAFLAVQAALEGVKTLNGWR